MTNYLDITEILKPLWDDDSANFTDEAQRGPALKVSQPHSRAKTGTPSSFSKACVLAPLISSLVPTILLIHNLCEALGTKETKR